MMKRRDSIKTLSATALAGLFPDARAEKVDDKKDRFSIEYVLSSALYGNMKLDTILPEVAKSGATGLDIWGKPHGSQREEVDEMGVDAFADLLRKHQTKLTVSTRYPLGCFGLQPEMPILKKLGGKILVCGSSGPKNPSGEEAKKLMKSFLEKMKPHADAAGEHGLVIALENHVNQLLFHPDSIRYFAEFNHHKALGMSFGPHHLHTFPPKIIPELIRELGNDNIPFIYFQEHSIGMLKKVDKEIEMQQLPGRGKLDYVPIVRALRDIQFTGVAEIFMHPTPRGIPILETAEAITGAINQSRGYIDGCIAKTA